MSKYLSVPSVLVFKLCRQLKLLHIDIRFGLHHLIIIIFLYCELLCKLTKIHQKIAKKMNFLCTVALISLTVCVSHAAEDDSVGYTRILQNAHQFGQKAHQYLPEEHTFTKNNYLELNTEHDVLSRAEQILFSEVGTNGSSYDVSSTCLNHTKIFLEALGQREMWALKSKSNHYNNKSFTSFLHFLFKV